MRNDRLYEHVDRWYEVEGLLILWVSMVSLYKEGMHKIRSKILTFILYTTEKSGDIICTEFVSEESIKIHHSKYT